eukprot:Skav210109  [mRNA]  locus=scaffold2194:46764:48585:+ [translate_table: standard]
MGGSSSHEISAYFGSKAYYSGELLKAGQVDRGRTTFDWKKELARCIPCDTIFSKDQRYKYSKDLATLTVTLQSGDKVTMWSYAIDVRDSEDPVKELPERGFNEEEDYVLFHYTDEEAMDCCGNVGFGKITSSKEVWASLSPQTDSNFGFGVYCARKAPHQWRSKKEMFLNNFFPSKKDWEDRKHLDFEEYPGADTLCFNQMKLDDRDLERLLGSEFGKAVLKKWEPTGKCNFCIPIVCDIHCAQDRSRSCVNGAWEWPLRRV